MPDLTYLRVFGALCYPANDSENLGKLKPTTDIGIFVGYASSRKGYRIYNKRARRLVPNSVPVAPYVPLTNKDLEILFQLMFDEYLEPPRVERSVSPAPAVPVSVNTVSTPSSTTIDQDAPSPSHSPSSLALQSLSLQQRVRAESTIMEDNPLAPVDNDPFRVILSMINQCLTGKNSGHDMPRYPVLQMLWGIITSSNVDYTKLMWEEFIQAIQTFLTDKANLGSPTKKGMKDKPHVIPYFRFKKLIICHLGRIHNIHQRSASLFHFAEKDFRLGNLKFVSKGEADEVFRMPIPNELISNNIRNAPYYNAYLEMVAKHDRKVAAEKEGKMKTASAKQPKLKPAIEKSSKPTPAPKSKETKERPSKSSTAKLPKSKPAKEKSTKTTPPQQAGKGKIAKVHKVKSPFQLVDEPDEEPAQSEPEPKLEHQEDTQPLPVLEGKAIKVSSYGPSAQAQDDTSTNIVHDSPSPADAETSVAFEKTNNGDQGQVGSDPGKTLESRPPPEQVVMDEDRARPDPKESRGALAGPDPEPTHDEFMDDLYPKVQESLMFLTDENVILEDPISSTGTLSSMKNLEDAYAIGDHFID
nr:integrase, catalytic region, zinc finger, CCHC-type, peptidase aspartic, catalytic [Tanacetum cinerariifolium]